MRSLRPSLIALFLLAASALPAMAAQPATVPAAAADHQRVLDYWTAARIASAQPRDFVLTASGYQPAAGKPGSAAARP